MEQTQNETLRRLTAAARWLLGQPNVAQTIDRLKMSVRTCEGPFVWSVIDPHGEILQRLPTHIKSVWIFVLKKNTRSICHFHPNSIQHMLVVEGHGSSDIGGIRKALREYDPSKAAENFWTVIDKNVPHEFFPEQTDMVVLSFHTCVAEDLIEIECGTGHQRFYETQSTN